MLSIKINLINLKNSKKKRFGKIRRYRNFEIFELESENDSLSKSSIAVDVKTDIKKVEKYLLNEKSF